MRFDIITIFPKIFNSYLNESILKRAQKKKLIEIKIHNLRDYSHEPRRRVDDKSYGGGPGMVLKIEPIIRAIQSLKLKRNVGWQVILFSPAGKQFTQKMAAGIPKKCDRVILVCGRYEGIDARLKKVLLDLGFRVLDLSIGPYVLTGGELPAMIVIDAVSRHISGVLGKTESLEEKRFGVGVPVYTRPEIFEYPLPRRGKKNKKYSVPKVLLSGNHNKIILWKKQK